MARPGAGAKTVNVCKKKDKYAGQVEQARIYNERDDAAYKAQQAAALGVKKMAMSENVKEEFLCLIKVVSYNMIEGIAMGVTFLAESFNVNPILPDFSMLIIGLALTLCYFYFYIRVPFFMIDLLLRMCFLVIMLPLFIVCFPFPKLRGYSKTGWEMLLSVLLQIISLCIFISLALKLVEHAL